MPRPAPPAIPPGYAPPRKPGGPLRPIVHEITPETAALLQRTGRAIYEPPPGWTPPAPGWDPETEEPWLLPSVEHDIASNPRTAAAVAVAVAGSVVDAAWIIGWPDDTNGLEPPSTAQVLGILADPYELARAVAWVVDEGEQDPARPLAPMEEQLRVGLALLEDAAAELRHRGPHRAGWIAVQPGPRARARVRTAKSRRSSPVGWGSA